jgi:hypothetical protein
MIKLPLNSLESRSRDLLSRATNVVGRHSIQEDCWKDGRSFKSVAVCMVDVKDEFVTLSLIHSRESIF